MPIGRRERTTSDVGTTGPGKGSRTNIGSSRSTSQVGSSDRNSWHPTTQTTSLSCCLSTSRGYPANSGGRADYTTASRSLGRAHGHLLTGKSLRSYSWLSTGFLRQYSSEKPVDWGLLDSDEAWHQPLVEHNFPPNCVKQPCGFTPRHRLYEIVSTLPRVLSHLDFWTNNLILRPDGSIALLDWAFVGDGAIGEDVGNLVPDAAFDHFIDAEALPGLEAVVRDAYLEGLANGGWNGDPRLAELGLCASAVKYDWLTPAMLFSASAPRQMRYGGTEEIDADFRFRQRGIALLDNAERARRAVTLGGDPHDVADPRPHLSAGVIRSGIQVRHAEK